MLIGMVIVATIMWVILMITLLVARRFVDMDFPPVPEFLWKSAVLAAVPLFLEVLVDMLGVPLVGLVVGILAFLTLAIKLFYLDTFQAILLMVAFWVIRFLVVMGVAALLVGFLQSLGEGSN